ncbi:alpha/beta hydrolase [Embleya sp. NBC_00896]|uniref:alpha/beta hydrolase n=1 Tax=Embleya sp. NBC_00896 TaxID=2975961 RepID=UPI0038679A9F|nr:lysophospholipase [Embleya sp. NBC_00896]
MAQSGIASIDPRVTFRSLDGLRLQGTLVRPDRDPLGVVVLVHGGGVTREEGGFFGRLAGGLAEAGFASLRFDFRGHGESAGRQEDLTLAGIVNDIRAAVDVVNETAGGRVHLIGASFGGGVSALYAARHPGTLRSLILFNPLLDYKKRFVTDKPYWNDDHIDADAGQALTERCFVAHSPTFRLGRPLLNEVFHLRPHEELGAIGIPTLFVHGTGDTFIPVDSSRRYVQQLGGKAELVELDGAQHGFAVHDDPQYADPQTQRWQAQVAATVAEWVTTHR